jgi:hypothetical protein
MPSYTRSRPPRTAKAKRSTRLARFDDASIADGLLGRHQVDRPLWSEARSPQQNEFGAEVVDRLSPDTDNQVRNGSAVQTVLSRSSPTQPRRRCETTRVCRIERRTR